MIGICSTIQMYSNQSSIHSLHACIDKICNLFPCTYTFFKQITYTREINPIQNVYFFVTISAFDKRIKPAILIVYLT